MSELYDLLKDPEEIQNLYAIDHPEAVRLQSFLDEREVTKVEPPDGLSAAPDESALGALGYGGGNSDPDDEEPLKDEPDEKEPDDR